jgi:hypothetical protein
MCNPLARFVHRDPAKPTLRERPTATKAKAPLVLGVSRVRMKPVPWSRRHRLVPRPGSPLALQPSEAGRPLGGPGQRYHRRCASCGLRSGAVMAAARRSEALPSIPAILLALQPLAAAPGDGGSQVGSGSRGRKGRAHLADAMAQSLRGSGSITGRVQGTSPRTLKPCIAAIRKPAPPALKVAGLPRCSDRGMFQPGTSLTF